MTKRPFPKKGPEPRSPSPDGTNSKNGKTPRKPSGPKRDTALFD